MTRRKRPAPLAGNRPISKRTHRHSSASPRRQDGFAAPTPEDRADTAVLAAAAALGYRIAVQCLDCGHWLANPASVEAHRGPVCRSKAVGR